MYGILNTSYGKKEADMLKRRIKKLTTSMYKKATEKKYLVCSQCSTIEVEVSSDTKSVICSYCVQQMLAPPPNYEKKEKSDKPRGWHFKAYYEHNGIVYSKGIEVTDPDEINRLKKYADVSEPSKSTKTKKSVKRKTKKRGKRNDRTTR